MTRIIAIFLTLIATPTFGQINMEDSTAQVISYWDIGEKQSYSMSLQTIRLNDSDTTSSVLMTYDVDITVVDSTANSYLLEWFYYNYKTNSEDDFISKLATVSDDIKVMIETDELGAITGVKNWEEVSEYMKNSIDQLKEEFKDAAQLDQVFAQLESMYSTKHGIEAAAIQDAQQFHFFHGAKYHLGEVLEIPWQTPNMYYPDSPFDADMTVYLDELNPDDNNFIMRASQEVDSEQLTKTTFDYLKSMAVSMGVDEPLQEDIGLLSNVTDTASRIHGSGWLIYSIQTKTVQALNVQNIEERIMEIK